MEVKSFIENYRGAFGDYELPIAIWYSDQAINPIEKTKGCFIGHLKPARQGGVVSLHVETVGCVGGKVYCGFTEAPPFIPGFVSGKERYKETPEMVTQFIDDLNLIDQSGKYIHFASIDQLENFDNIEGLIFFASPDVLTGLISWVFYDTNAPDAVTVPFGSGCSSIVSQTVVENRSNGQRTFLGLFDPSVRPHVEPDILSLSIPMSRFKTMYHTFNESCLSGAHAWGKVKNRIVHGEIG